MPNRFAAYQPTADEFPTTVADAFLKRNAGNTAWEEVAYGAAPPNVGTAAAAGTANSPSRSDHVHDLPESVVRSVLLELTADPDFNARKLVNVATPTASGDVATKGYVDAAAAGARDPKDSCRVASTANLTLSGTQTIDGVAVVAGDRVLAKNQTTGSENGIYVVAAGAWTRAADSDTSAEVTAGMFVWVTEGTTNADSGWLLTTDDPITLGTTALTFTQVSGLGQVTAGLGLTKTGNTLDVGAGNGIQVNTDSIEVLYAAAQSAGRQTLAGAAAGTANTALRGDAVLAYDTAVAGDIAGVGTAAAAGTSNKFPRADHVHAHGDQTSATLHAAATQSANGFLPSTDKKKIDDLIDATTTATATTTDATVTTVGSLSTSDNLTYVVEADVMARRTDVAGTGAAYKLIATFRRGVGAASIVQIGSTSVVSQHEDAAALDATIDSETTGGTIRVRVTGVAAQTFNWRSRIQASSV